MGGEQGDCQVAVAKSEVVGTAVTLPTCPRTRRGRPHQLFSYHAERERDLCASLVKKSSDMARSRSKCADLCLNTQCWAAILSRDPMVPHGPLSDHPQLLKLDWKPYPTSEASVAIVIWGGVETTVPTAEGPLIGARLTAGGEELGVTGLGMVTLVERVYLLTSRISLQCFRLPSESARTTKLRRPSRLSR
ncbi:hypothetical protein E2C01_006064 [Portunus trituberculatus]|uniref:Uncharacterized protein n=1 Tax=Portunus trituberculatus TaxID=210409 RepID=A0A5B7CX59_PORTR|nr:hypothetical protein [Portunus trituberculatus]